MCVPELFFQVAQNPSVVQFLVVLPNHVFHQLCQLDEEDRRNNRDPQWQDIVTPADRLRAFDNRIDVAYLAENTLLDELRYIERDLHNTNVRLTGLGRENCARGIDVPPSDIQKLRKQLGE